MPELEADFIIEPPEGFDCSFEINANSTIWGNIEGDIENQTDLKNALDSKADDSEITEIDGRLDTIESTLSGYGNIVTHDTDEFATAAQGALADSAVQPSDLNNYVPNTRTVNGKSLSSNITLNYSDVGALADTTTISDLATETQMDAINSGANTTNIGQITTNTNDITAINEKIPEQASTTNQLADKNFVNSSIATNTANFIGTFNSVAELEAYSGTLTNNDYAFVISTDVDGNTVYNRYKYNGETEEWLFEYALNNSSFTSTQWAAINSGITSSDVTTIGTALQPNDNITELNNNAGYITGITSTDVTDALGYAPYNSTNPNNYSSTLNGLTDVALTSPTQGQNLTYDAVNQKWINSSTTATVGWGGITGTLSDQTDLQNALDDKQNVIDANNKLSASYVSGLSTVATSGSYDDLTDKPTIPSAQVNSDWDANSGVAQILNKPTLSTVATSGDYNDLENKPTIPTDVSDLTNTTLANVLLSNLDTDGNNKLYALKGWTENGQVYSDTQLYNDIYAQYSTATSTGTDLIITDNYTVVGSPTITDGVMSNIDFRTEYGGYATTQGIFTQNFGDYDTWEIEIPFTFRSSFGNNFDILLFDGTTSDTDRCLAIQLRAPSSQLRIYLVAQDGTNISIGDTSTDTFTAGESLTAKLVFTGTQYILYTKKPNEDWKAQITKNNSKKLKKSNNPVRFGVDWRWNENWDGSINLYGIRFIGNNKLVYACKCQIPYNISDSGNKIADVQYRPDVYYANYLGYKSSYFSIDTTNQNVTLPYTDVYGLINKSLDYNYKQIQGYDGTATQTLKHVNGVLQWVTD